MKHIKLYVFLLIIPLFSFVGVHKYYISMTQIDYVEEKQSIQIITRIFLDDFENVLKERYDDEIMLAVKDELNVIDKYIEKYLKAKIKAKVNGEDINFNYIGKAYDTDVIKCYLEITDVKSINTFEFSNQVLFDLFEDQQNIIKTKINSKQKSFILTSQNNTFQVKF